MTERPSLSEAGITAVAITRWDIGDVSLFQAKCLSCGWVCHTEEHRKESTAIRHAEAHTCPTS